MHSLAPRLLEHTEHTERQTDKKSSKWIQTAGQAAQGGHDVTRVTVANIGNEWWGWQIPSEKLNQFKKLKRKKLPLPKPKANALASARIKSHPPFENGFSCTISLTPHLARSHAYHYPSPSEALPCTLPDIPIFSCTNRTCVGRGSSP